MAATPFLRRLLLGAALVTALSIPVFSQDRASLVADALRIEGDSVLVAEGDVEVFFQGRRLTAARIVYDQKGNRLQIEGPIRLTDESGNTVILASQADMSADLTEGLLTSARVVLDNQLQIAATEARRIGGRYLELDNTVASSCRVCAQSDTPLWEIRARRVTHDQTEKQLYFDHAQLRVAGVPVFYIPRLRMPDPTLKRANGFLLPKLSNSTLFGTGVEIPYFLTLGRSRDLLITPFASSNDTRSVALRYRQAFRTGDLTVNSALTQDATGDGPRGYAFADGRFRLPQGYRLTLHGEAVTDLTYLSDYDITDADRLTSFVDITRVTGDELVFGKLRGIKSLRKEENDSAMPSVVGDAEWQRRFTRFGGTGNLRFSSHSHLRNSESLLDGDGDLVPDGRDLSRVSVGADWRRDWVLPFGLLGAVLGETRLDSYSIGQDPALSGNPLRLWGATGAELRWPLVKTETSGARQVLEPVLQIVAAGASDAAIPNEDSLLVEFDEASLLSLNRYPGADAVETGLHANLALSWKRFDADGWSMGVTAGRVLRASDGNAFSLASGLGGIDSDWLASVFADNGSGLFAAGRIIADDSLNIARGEAEVQYTTKVFSLGSSYVWSIADAAELRDEDVSEMALNLGYGLNSFWRATASGRYDFTTGSASRAGLGLRFRNECVLLDLSLSRRFSASSSVKADTRFGVTLELTGFGGGDGPGPARVCRG